MQQNGDYWRFAESERHFNEIQAGIRNIASGWMLAAFGSIALLLRTGDGAGWVVPPALLVGVVCCMATVGLLVLWINDQLVYQQLLNAGFLVGLKREFEDPSLPPVRCMMLYATEGLGMSRRMTLFYMIPMAVFCLITAAASWFLESPGDGGGWSRWAVWLTVLVGLEIIQMGSAVWVLREDVSIRAHVDAFLDEEFATLVKAEAGKRKALLARLIARPRLASGAGARSAETTEVFHGIKAV